MAAPLEDWYKNMPPVTKTYMTGCVVTTLAVYLDVIHPLDLYVNFHLVIAKYEVFKVMNDVSDDDEMMTWLMM